MTRSASRGLADSSADSSAGSDAQMRASIANPILPGFHPDPSIIRVGHDYFIATSTFEWFPGVRLHHSRDLVHWRPLVSPLTRQSQLDLTGVPDSGGVWAPCLSWFDGQFFLVYSIVHELNSRMKDVRNYLVVADDIEGPWSEPIALSGSGFDPSLFHARDGRKWLLNMVWDHRPGPTHFYGIALQEFCLKAESLVGEPRIVYRGTELDFTEGPHLYEREGYYYLLTAEGGTSWDHAATIARADKLEGPYEPCPHNPLLTSKDDPTGPLQKAGHGDLVETQDGQWYLAHLCARPLPGLQRCPLGRETALQRVVWTDNGWPRLDDGGRRPSATVRSPGLPRTPWPGEPDRDDFQSPVLRAGYQSPRHALGEDRLSLSERPGVLRLRGGQSLASRFDQSLVALRLEAFRTDFETALEFQPKSFQQMAGLACYYSTRLWHYACLSHDEKRGRCLYLQSNDQGQITFPLAEPIAVPAEGVVKLRAEFDAALLRFFFALGDDDWRPLGEPLDASLLSDDYGADWGFTGCFAGMACQDLTGQNLPADFHYFERRSIS